MGNTRIDYTYRGAANYKRHAAVVFAGEITDEQHRRISAALLPGGRFTADQVGLADLRELMPGSYEDDPEWHELTSITATDQSPDEPEATIAEFAARFDTI